MRDNDIFCRRCGTKFEQTSHPKKCQNCKHEVYQNPNPVAVVIQPVHNRGIISGVAICRRAIAPVGGLALIGGHMEIKENLFEAAEREFREETSHAWGGNPRIVDHINNQKGMLIFFLETDPIDEEEFIATAIPCVENFEIMTTSTSVQMCFPHHQLHLDRYLSTRLGLAVGSKT